MGSATKKLVYVDGEPHWLSAEEQEALGIIPRRSGLPGIASGYSEGKPGKSLSMSCHPSQVKLMNDTMADHGISGVEWDKRGKCRITSRRARARAMPIVGNMLRLGRLHDEDGCYGDG
ncbi:MAG TPA: hypothetical protein VNA25_22855 [Phycisphaerae bacterium]|nr:hypothetical protein [Phycisphaerae bacterium]